MVTLRTVSDVIERLQSPETSELPAPVYRDSGLTRGVMFAVESMKDHMTDEGWQLALALQHAGYELFGYGIGDSITDVGDVLHWRSPAITVMQDKREWNFAPGNFREDRAAFHNYDKLRDRGTFNLTVLKDAHHGPAFHKQSAVEMGVHAWITYYHPRIVKHLAPYVRRRHLVRTYHSIDKLRVPTLVMDRPDTSLLSGAVSNAYPLRMKIREWSGQIPGCSVLRHPGYHRGGTASNDYLLELNRHKVAFCTSSKYGYALRKIIEATACGCMVVTDLPTDDVLPRIDGNLHRVHPMVGVEELSALVCSLYQRWDPKQQFDFARKAMEFYDYRAQGVRLAQDIINLKTTYEKQL